MWIIFFGQFHVRTFWRARYTELLQKGRWKTSAHWLSTNIFLPHSVSSLLPLKRLGQASRNLKHCTAVVCVQLRVGGAHKYHVLWSLWCPWIKGNPFMQRTSLKIRGITQLPPLLHAFSAGKPGAGMSLEQNLWAKELLFCKGQVIFGLQSITCLRVPGFCFIANAKM